MECGRIVRGVIRRAQIGRFRVQRRRRHTAALPLRIGMSVVGGSRDAAQISDAVLFACRGGPESAGVMP